MVSLIHSSLLSSVIKGKGAKEGSILQEEKITAKLKEAAKDGKISCAMAQKIAMDNKIPMKQVGNLLNQMKIKIHQCQLGCF